MMDIATGFLFGREFSCLRHDVDDDVGMSLA